ncbi:Transcriptional regulatory protein LiaR [Roseovarius gaetbuli]|uniref:Transcriptional regulatory protein LiaR n=2 Tax=Roseovarius gaetbuli TaxID=1356575 RepID=A0A1X6Z1T8_9RHOB|nr:Transcriptional regulatory protein LiaR [Roseovarius gaetbuli]
MLSGEMPNGRVFDGFFVGSPLSFSDAVLNLAERELGYLNFTRIAAVGDLFDIEAEERTSVRIILVDETMVGDLEHLIVKLRAEFPNTHFALAYRNASSACKIVESTHKTPDLRHVGFLPMQIEVDRWVSVLRLLVCGERYVPSELLSPEQSPHALSPGPRPNSHSETADAEATAQDAHLTDRELQVLRSVAEGKQNKIIADELKLSQHTVKLHLHHVIAKLGVNNRTEAAVWFLGNKDKIERR